MARTRLPLGEPGQVRSGRRESGVGQRVPLYPAAQLPEFLCQRTGAGTAPASSPRQMGVFARVEGGQGWGRQEKGRKNFHSLQRNDHSSELFFSGYKSKMQSVITWKDAPYNALVIREMSIKTTTRCHFPPIRMARINKTDHSKCWWGCGAAGTLIQGWWEWKTGQEIWKVFGSFSKSQHAPTIRSSKATPRHLLSKISENVSSPHKDLYMNVRSSIIQNS